MHTLGATNVHRYTNTVSHEMQTLTQNPKLFDIISPVVGLAAVQLVANIPM